MAAHTYTPSVERLEKAAAILNPVLDKLWQLEEELRFVEIGAHAIGAETVRQEEITKEQVAVSMMSLARRYRAEIKATSIAIDEALTALPR